VNSITIQPLTKPLNAVAVPPGSKSITNRALILAAISGGTTVLNNVLDAEDTQVMSAALQQIGVARSEGTGTDITEIYVGNSGTTARFLTAMLAFTPGKYRLYGKPRMHERPIRDLVDALKHWNANIEYENNNGCPPLIVNSGQQAAENEDPLITSVTGNVSSQFLSALLLSAPLAAQNCQRQGAEIRLTGELVSKPYIEMTLAMMKSFGVEPVVTDNFSSFRFPKGTTYRPPKVYDIEPDASAASYFFAAAAVAGGSIIVNGLSKNSLQGDVAFVNALERMGCAVEWKTTSITVKRSPEQKLRGITVDMNSYSDTVQTLAAVALFADGATEIMNVEHIRFKETDRIAAVAAELRKFGAAVEERRDGLRITPPKQLQPASVATYDDHRMAMSFAVAGLKITGVVIQDPDCVQKTFPNFFEVFPSGALSHKSVLSAIGGKFIF
jgi:3-phosphoshikimate 1-carboxyvinyltransferase